jgi:CRP-like cAMP-binding protein
MTEKSASRFFVPAKAIIFKEGATPDFAYVVLSGLVEITTNREGALIVLATIKPGEMFGELALVGETLRVATATASEKCELMRIDRKLLDAKIRGLDPVMRYWLRSLVARVRSMSKQVGNRKPRLGAP